MKFENYMILEFPSRSDVYKRQLLHPQMGSSRADVKL